MKALTVREPWASMIADGTKTVEVRSRPTKHRGELAIHVAKPTGEVICTVELVDCRPMLRSDYEAAGMPEEQASPSGLFAWVLSTPRLVVPVKWRGQLGIWNLPDESITYI